MLPLQVNQTIFFNHRVNIYRHVNTDGHKTHGEVTHSVLHNILSFVRVSKCVKIPDDNLCYCNNHWDQAQNLKHDILNLHIVNCNNKRNIYQFYFKKSALFGEVKLCHSWRVTF